MPRSIDYTADDELPMIGGDVSAHHHAHELLNDEQEALAAELAAHLARKRPIGFVSKWDD